MDEENADLIHAVARFDQDLTASLTAFAGYCPPFEYTRVPFSNGETLSIRFAQGDGEPAILSLKSRGKTVIGVKPEFRCSWDSSGSFLAVEQSSFAVYPFAKVGTDPLLRLEYVRNQAARLPSSHLHVHAHRDEFTHLLGFAAKLDAQREGQVTRYFSRPSLLSDFHFPTGGHRFRPCLEDLLEVLRVEFELDVDNNAWQPQLASAREKWRRIQTAAVVRDCPEEALRVLVEDFGMPRPTGWECPPTNLRKFTRS